MKIRSKRQVLSKAIISDLANVRTELFSYSIPGGNGYYFSNKSHYTAVDNYTSNDTTNNDFTGVKSNLIINLLLKR